MANSDYEIKNNTASLFKSKYKIEKQKSGDENANKLPDYSGKALVSEVEYYVSAWVRETKNGEKYFSISLKPVDEYAESKKSAPKAGAQNTQAQKPEKKAKHFDPSDDDLPF